MSELRRRSARFVGRIPPPSVPVAFPISRLGPWRRVRRRGRRTRAWWRRSLQVRVISTTLLVSAVAVALLGFLVLQQVRSGLLEAKVRSSLTDHSVSMLHAAGSVDEGSDVDSSEVVARIGRNLTTQRSTQTGNFEVVISSAAGGTLVPGTNFASNGVLPTSIPERLKASVARGGAQYYTYSTLDYADGTRVPGLVVGGLVTAQDGVSFELYLLFPLEQEAATITLVTRTIIATGAGLVLLLVGIAWLVTRQVVMPVRLAARSAERLAAGALDERVTVRGEDDLARLGSSFNKMAAGLQRQIRRLEELSRMQRRFVSDVSHELRTPLTTVRMAADVLYESRGQFEPEVGRSAELLQTQLDRFEALLADLLEISRHDAGAVVLDAEAVDVRDIVRRSVDVAQPLAQRRGSEIVLHQCPQACVCDVDDRRIERILRNLFANAIEHCEGRPIDVYVACNERAVGVAVRDHGSGLQHGHEERVFDRFWRADPARSRHTGGTGLGLAIALEDARLHGGSLEAWGRPGQGSQFVLTLPRVHGERVDRAPLPARPADVPALEAALSDGALDAGDVLDADGLVDAVDVLDADAPVASPETPPPSQTGTRHG